MATGTFSLHIELGLPWSSWKEKRHSSFRRYSGLQIRQIQSFKSGWLQRVEHPAREGVQKLNKTHITDLDDLKHCIRTEWAKLDHAVIAAAVRQWRRRLSACVKAGGGHFEHCF